MFQEIIEIFGELPRAFVWIQVADMNDLLVADNMVIGDDEWNRRTSFSEKSNGDTRSYPRYDLWVEVLSCLSNRDGPLSGSSFARPDSETAVKWPILNRMKSLHPHVGRRIWFSERGRRRGCGTGGAFVPALRRYVRSQGGYIRPIGGQDVSSHHQDGLEV